MSDYSDLVRREARWYILEIVRNADGEAAPVSIIVQMLDEVAIKYSHDQVMTEVTWLGEQGFVDVLRPKSVPFARLTYRGADLLEGRTKHPAITKPRTGF